MTHREQLAILALIAALVLLAILFPRQAGADAPVVAGAVPAGEFVAAGSGRSSSPGWAPTPGTKPPTAPPQPRTPSPSASLRVPTATPVRIPAPTERAVAMTGTASWWASFGPGVYAALPGYVAGTHVTIRVCSGSRCTTAPVITSCQCFVGTAKERIADLSPGILAALGLDKARGLFRVSVEVTP